MALSRIGSTADLANLFARSSYAATSPRHGRQNVEKLHASTIRRYPEAPHLPLPSNVSQIFNIETSRFAPERARDISTPLCMYNSHPEKFAIGFNAYGIGDGNSSSSLKMQQTDAHVDSYDCFGAVSLSSSMQTNVPKPFCSSGKSSYLNMPGGQWARDGKYIAEIMKKSQFTVGQMRQMKRSGMLDGLLLKTRLARDAVVVRCYSTNKGPLTGRMTAAEQQDKRDEKVVLTAKEQKEEKGGAAAAAASDGTKNPPPVADLSKREKLQLIIKHYGRTVIVFHITISLLSLGTFYTLVSSGLDVTPIIKVFSDPTPAATEVANAAASETGEAAAKDEDPLVKMIMGEGSTFLIAYAIHKLFAPVRISLTLAFTPMIVKYLRRKGILKMPKKPPMPT